MSSDVRWSVGYISGVPTPHSVGSGCNRDERARVDVILLSCLNVLGPACKCVASQKTYNEAVYAMIQE